MGAGRTEKILFDVGEFGLLSRFLPTLPTGPGVVLGPGDDTAVLRPGRRSLLFTTDALVEGVHFERAWFTARQLGRKAYLVNASDIAAMGGRPTFCVVSTGSPPDMPVRFLSSLHRGLAAAARETGAVLVGGNLTRSSSLFVSVALLGEAESPVSRGKARVGDHLFVTGTLGVAALGLRALRSGRDARGAAVARFREPVPRLQAGAALARAGVVSAMIDVSDGLVRDLAHICEASGVGAEIELERIPRPRGARKLEPTLLLAGGEDYELLCSVPERGLGRLKRLLPRLGCPMTRIGRVRPRDHGIRVRGPDGRLLDLRHNGFDHFGRGCTE